MLASQQYQNVWWETAVWFSDGRTIDWKQGNNEWVWISEWGKLSQLLATRALQNTWNYRYNLVLILEKSLALLWKEQARRINSTGCWYWSQKEDVPKLAIVYWGKNKLKYIKHWYSFSFYFGRIDSQEHLVSTPWSYFWVKCFWACSRRYSYPASQKNIRVVG